MFVEINLIRPVAEHNLNRQKEGRPKTTMFGGVLRTKLSSQSQKAAARKALATHGILPNELAYRTRVHTSTAVKMLIDKGHTKEEAELVAKFANRLLVGGETDADSRKVDEGALIFVQDIHKFGTVCATYFDELLEQAQIQADESKAAADAKDKKKTKEGKEDKKATKSKAKNPLPSDVWNDLLDLGTNIDLALCGRCIMSQSHTNIDGAVFVASAISVDPAIISEDWFTGMDQIKNEAAMLPGDDKRWRTSGTYYQRSTVNIDILIRHFGNDPELIGRAVYAWCHSFVHDSLPSGNKTSTDPNTGATTAFLTLTPRGGKNLAPFMAQAITEGDLPDIAGQKMLSFADAAISFTGHRETKAWYGSIYPHHTSTTATKTTHIDDIIDGIVDHVKNTITIKESE